ncbi:MAG: HNH endonuclease [Patescibacteria group bacterium]
MPIVKCAICAKNFYTKPSWIKSGGGKYCSIKCSAWSKRRGLVVGCFICNKEVYKSLEDLKNSKSKNYFCSKKCSLRWNTSLHMGADSPNWRGGKSSYKNILSRDKIEKVCILCGKDNYKILSAHHIDQNRNNNDITNLTWLCQNCHFLVHHYDLEKKKLSKLHANQ